MHQLGLFRHIPCLVLVCGILFFASRAGAGVIFREDFDTDHPLNKDLYRSDFSNHRIENGRIVFHYTTAPNSEPVGLECALPATSAIPDERDIEMNFMGGGADVSNSAFVCYAAGPGRGFLLTPFPYGPRANKRTGDRTGYVIRFLRHGDGTNEVLFYRNDTGWLQKLNSYWIPSNPVATLRRVTIRHRRTGEHEIAAIFDTGVPYERIFRLEDGVYPPNHANRGLQLVLKAHSSVSYDLQFTSDTWIVTDKSVPAPQTRKKRPGDTVTRASAATDDADALDRLGRTDVSMERYSDAHQHLSRALELRKKSLGPAHPLVMESMVALAGLYTTRDPGRAELLYAEALQMSEGLSGPDSPALTPLLLDISGFYMNQNRFDRALSFSQRALAIQERFPGRPDRRVACLLNLASLHMKQGRQDDAEILYRRALEVKEKDRRPDPNDPDILMILQNLEVIYSKPGRNKEAEAVYGRLVEMSAHWPPGHERDTARRLNNLGVIHRDRTQYVQAEVMFKRAARMWEKAHGPEYVEIASALSNLGWMYAHQGRSAEAEDVYKQALAIREKSLGSNHPLMENVLANLGDLYLNLRRHPDAEVVFKRLAAIQEGARGKTDGELATTLVNLSAVYYSQRRYADAEPLIRRALEIKETLLGPEHPDLLAILENLAKLYRKTGNLSAEYYRSRAEKIRSKQTRNRSAPVNAE
ncbi:MAG: hypothetical protein A3G34_06430 [Candidatus Lindowbacteria bacterium RIFCSPLOWO2_12_FULL_62_27]|nr:MAG: hypothetical protein A3G34_06430 [Candidatus Lindowbacteria bacterium RIFCSPLOWO2_12_FULL_62_27]OGH63733.1 MAG: hypothetical protein A3I06_01175 [Candidatus Lindowbacteria bacterium RIFCSPLOWO2_02_FULL_62_12]